MNNYRAVYHQILAFLPIGLSECAMGFGYGWGPPIIKKLLDQTFSEISPTVDECSWIASLAELGRTFGPVLSILSLDALGRKLVIQLATATFFVTWLSILFTRSVLILYVVRFAFGFAAGMTETTTAIYLGEVCLPKTRGTFCSAGVACFYLALVIENAIATYVSYNVTAQISLSVAFICFLSTLLLVESPQFLMLHERYEEAERNLMWLKGISNQLDVKDEFEIIQENVASEKIVKNSYKKLLLAPSNYRSVTIMLISTILFTATGCITVSIYSTIIFPSTKFLTSYELTICFGIVRMMSAILSAFVIEKYNRRTLTLFSFFIFIICHSIIAFLFYADHNFFKAEYTPWIIFILLCIFAGFSAIVDTLMYTIKGEIFPQSIRPFGSGLCILFASCTSFVAAKTFLTIKDTYGIHFNFVIFAAISFTAFLYSYFKLPETRGKTIIDVQRSLENCKAIPPTVSDRQGVLI